MKLKNVTKSVNKTIQQGWRNYCELKFTYEQLGLNRNDFITEAEIFETMKLTKKEDSGFVDHYRGLDLKRTHKGIPLTVGFNFAYESSLEATEWDRNKDKYFEESDGRYYYLEGSAGYVNPEYDVDNDNYADYDVPYWLFDDVPELKRHEWFLAKDSISDEYKLMLKKFTNNKEFGWDMYGRCNDKYNRETKEWENTNKYNKLCEALSELSEYNKTNYYTFTETHVHICYAIRYDYYVKPFLADFKKIVKEHKLKNYIVNFIIAD